MFRVLVFALSFLTVLSLSAAPKRKVQVNVEVWKNGKLDSSPQFIVTEGEEASLAQSSDALSFKMNVSPQNSPFSDKAFKIALQFVEVKNGEDQEPLTASVETTSYAISTVKFLPPTQEASPVELKITAKPL
jgi:hypothetical protein